MILLAYGCLIVALAAFLIRGRSSRRPSRSDVLSRLAGMIAATATASIALLLLSTIHPTTLGLVVVIVLLLGSVLYLAGLALWHQHAGFTLRLIGLILTVGALAIPSTLTLILPLAALSALTLRPAPAAPLIRASARH